MIQAAIGLLAMVSVIVLIGLITDSSKTRGVLQMAESKKCCAECEHWTPKYKGIGQCVQEGLPNASFWVAERGSSSQLLTLADFHCAAHRVIEKTEVHTL